MPGQDPHQQPCLPKEDIPVSGLNLTAAEAELLDDICWPAGGHSEAAPLRAPSRRGVPFGINCTVTTWWGGRQCSWEC